MHIGNDGTLDNAEDVVGCVSIQPVSKLVTFVLCREWAFLNWRLSGERVQRGLGYDPLLLDGVIPVYT